tara:strand:- start:248 stop:604 length:357 start_codon:yes stop_codon:yes gene_type:complete
MRTPINILDSGKEIELQPGIYSVRVLGGWKIKTSKFSLELRHTTSDLKIELRKTFWRIQSYELKKRAKKIGSVDIPKWGNYTIHFKHPEDLKVKRDNIPLLSIFQNYQSMEEIRIIIG